MEEEITFEIIKKTKNYGYKSVKFQLALVNNNETWEILVGNIFLDTCEPKEDKTHLKKRKLCHSGFLGPL